MKNYKLQWRGIGLWQDNIMSGLNNILIENTRYIGPTWLVLATKNNYYIKITNNMNYIDERREIGVLNLETIKTSPALNSAMKIDLTGYDKCTTNILKYSDSEVYSESGITIHGQEKRLIIVAGTTACTLAIDGVGKFDHIFEPEYNIEKYDII